MAFQSLLVQLLALPAEDEDDGSEEEATADRLDKLRLLLEMMLLYTREISTRGAAIFPQEGEQEEGRALQLPGEAVERLCAALVPPAYSAVLPATLAMQSLELLTLLAADPNTRQHLHRDAARESLQHFCTGGEDGKGTYSEDISSGFKALVSS